MLIFTSHNVLTEKDSPLGYLLLRCIRAYLDVTMWQSFEVHTEDTISDGEEAVQNLGEMIKVIKTQLFTIIISCSQGFWVKEFINTSSDEEQFTNFDFPKLHAQLHSFKDILAKGVLRNFTTRLFERLHGILKVWYQNRTNFKDVASQVCKQLYNIIKNIFLSFQPDFTNCSLGTCMF
jgi:hypothetical protein